MPVAPVPGNGLPLFQARRTALVVIKLQLNCYDKRRRELSERGAAKSARSYPLWVKSRHSVTSERCPLYPQKQTSLRATGMSALCHRATYASAAIDRDLLGQVLTNFRQQFARAVGLRDISVAAGRMRFAIIAAQSVGSYGDNRNAV